MQKEGCSAHGFPFRELELMASAVLSDSPVNIVVRPWTVPSGFIINRIRIRGGSTLIPRKVREQVCVCCGREDHRLLVDQNVDWYDGCSCVFKEIAAPKSLPSWPCVPRHRDPVYNVRMEDGGTPFRRTEYHHSHRDTPGTSRRTRRSIGSSKAGARHPTTGSGSQRWKTAYSSARQS